MKILRRILVWLAALIGVLALQGCSLLFWAEQGPSRTLSSALADARSVSAVEFTPYFYKAKTGEMKRQEVVLQRLTLSEAQIERLRAATPGSISFHLETDVASCFQPHHRVEVVRKDGSSFLFSVCFHCGSYRMDHGDIVEIPAEWLPRLRQYFTDLGMPLRTDEEYQQLAETKLKS